MQNSANGLLNQQNPLQKRLAIEPNRVEIRHFQKRQFSINLNRAQLHAVSTYWPEIDLKDAPSKYNFILVSDWSPYFHLKVIKQKRDFEAFVFANFDCLNYFFMSRAVDRMCRTQKHSWKCNKKRDRKKGTCQAGYNIGCLGVGFLYWLKQLLMSGGMK